MVSPRGKTLASWLRVMRGQCRTDPVSMCTKGVRDVGCGPRRVGRDAQQGGAHRRADPIDFAVDILLESLDAPETEDVISRHGHFILVALRSVSPRVGLG